MAVWLPELGAVFIAIPKTGSQWVRAALHASGIRCEPAGGAGDHQPPEAYRPGRRFCFVRHPVAWLQSAWRGLHTSWPNRRELAPLHRERTWSPIRNLTYLVGDSTYDAFVDNILTHEPGYVTRMFETYIGPVGFPRVDHVGRQEHLRADLQVILQRLGWDGELADVPPANEGTGPQVPCYRTRQILAAERPTMERWYSSDGPFEVTV